MIKHLALSILNFINAIVPKGNTVVFNSFPDLEGNSLALYRYIASERTDLFDTYRIVWSVQTDNLDAIRRRLEEINGRKDHLVVKKLSLKGIFTYFRASKIITTHNYITGLYTAKGQTHFNLWHGMPFKAGSGLMNNPNGKDYMQADITIVCSDFFKTVKSKTDRIPIEKIKVTGQPADDSALRPDNALLKLGVKKSDYSKVILWLPTYRKSDVGSLRDDGGYDSFGVSEVLRGEKNDVDIALKQSNILLLVKFHPMDVLKNERFPEHENILIIKNEDMEKKGVTVNELMGDCDSLISDYSSAFITYLLTARPIAFVVGDMEKYKQSRGFSVDEPEKLLPGEKICDKEGFINYLKKIDVINAKWQDKYAEVRSLMHKYTDGRSSERVCNMVFGENNRKHRILIFHPTIAPYRIDFFNELHDRLGARICLYYKNLKSQKFDYDAIAKEFHFEPDYFSRSIKIGRREFYIGHMKRMKAYRPDVVIAGEYGLGLWTAVLYKKLFNRSCKVISLCDDSLDIALKCKGMRRISRDMAMKHIDGLILCSKKTASFYRKCFGMDSFVFPIIEKEERFHADKDEAVLTAGKLISEYGLEGKRVFLFVGRIAPEKNIEYLLKSFIHAHEMHKENVLCLIGNDGGNGYEEKLKTIVMAARAEEYIFFVGRKEGLMLKAWMYLGQCLVLPSKYEPFGAVVGEALMSGEYVMVSKKAGAADLIIPLDKENGNGIVIDIDKPYIEFDEITEQLVSIGQTWEPHDNRQESSFDTAMKRLSTWLTRR